MTYVAMKTHGDVVRLMHEPYHRTLWTFFQLKEHERFAAFEERARAITMASLIAIAFHEPNRLADQQYQLKSDMGATRDHETVIEGAQDVIEAMRQIHAGTLKTQVLGQPSVDDVEAEVIEEEAHGC